MKNFGGKLKKEKSTFARDILSQRTSKFVSIFGFISIPRLNTYFVIHGNLIQNPVHHFDIFLTDFRGVASPEQQQQQQQPLLKCLGVFSIAANWVNNIKKL